MLQDLTVPFLGLYCIVRDEHDTIDALLKSVLETADGPAFDEFCFVDTGSTDDTRDLIAKACQKALGWPVEMTWPEKAGDPPTRYAEIVKTSDGVERTIHLILARFDWINDFAAARNYAFGLGTAIWRGYLDADDTFPNAQRLRPGIWRTQHETSKHSNCITMRYAYVENETGQEVTRFVRWEAGFHWIDEIHEHLVRKSGPRIHTQFTDLVVIHRKTDAQHARSVERNLRMCEEALARAREAGDCAKMGRMAYHLGTMYRVLGPPERARAYFEETAERLRYINLGTLALVELAKMDLECGNAHDAINHAGIAAARNPEAHEPLAILAIAHEARGDHHRAADVFDRLAALPPALLATLDDLTFNKGQAKIHAAKAYFAVGRNCDAHKALDSIPDEIVQHPLVRPDFTELDVVRMKKEGLIRVRQLWEYLLWDTQPVLARLFLDHCVPAAVADQPEIAAMRRYTMSRIPHMKSWEDYKKTYAAIPEEDYHTKPQFTDQVRSMGRAREILAWAQQLPTEGPPVQILSVGPQDAIMENDVLAACPRTYLIVCDVAPQATPILTKLAEKYPGRVTHKQIVKDDTDWPSIDGGYDAIFIFEVLEHVESDTMAADKLYELLGPTGTLFLSTPAADHWVESYLTDVAMPQVPYYHVRAHNPSSLWELLCNAGFQGTLKATDYGTAFLARMRREKMDYFDNRNIAIFCPNVPHPFDAESPERGFLGGSEECVVYLAAALAKIGHRVTVYTTPPKRGDYTIHAHEGVRWRPLEEFDVEGNVHETVLFWRCPNIVARPAVRKASYQKVLWLHDAAYGVWPDSYKAADKVIVLSRAHADAITAFDGYDGPFAIGQNGIDAAQFSLLTKETEKLRDPHKVIYCSSPDRGLERLLDTWLVVRTAVPQATLDIYYNWTIFRRTHPKDAARLDQKIADLANDGVKFIGGVSQPVLHEVMRKAGVWAYFNHGSVETSCITAMKVMAAGCWPVASNAGALPETLGGRTVFGLDDSTIDTDVGRELLRDALIHALQYPAPFTARLAMHLEAVERFDWNVTAKKFLDIMES